MIRERELGALDGWGPMLLMICLFIAGPVVNAGTIYQ
jgi:hypothetical protein